VVHPHGERALSLRAGLCGVALTFTALTGSAPAAQPETEWRTGFLDCGRTRIRALTECYPDTSLCLTETLTFERNGRRAVVPLHQHYGRYPLERASVRALNYRATSWACLEGGEGGHYVNVVMARVGQGCRSACAFEQMFDLSGRLVASRLAFGPDGAAREDARSLPLMLKLIAQPQPGAFETVYR
jgi:hypothetical protein